jgi:1-acyl-sn-glycerol-3-phosphate acyltransferase
MILFVKKTASSLWKIWFLLYMIISTLFFYPFLLLSIVVFKNYELTFKIYRIWGWSICIAIGIFPSAIHLNKLPKNSKYIMVSNHSSYLDIIVSYTKIKQHYAFLAKEELKKAPLFNINFKGMNVTVQRQNARSGNESLTECNEKLKQNINLLIFPEGTRSVTAPKMRNFKNGAFKLAILNQTDIVPVVFLDNYKRLKSSKSFFNDIAGPGKSRMKILSPISTKNMSLDDVEQLKQEVFKLIQAEILMA